MEVDFQGVVISATESPEEPAEHDVTVVSLDAGKAQNGQSGHEERNLTKQLSGDLAFPGMGRDGTSRQAASQNP